MCHRMTYTHVLSPKRYFLSGSSFLYILLVYKNVFLRAHLLSEQNNRKLRVSGKRWHTIDDCCEDFLRFRHSDKLSRTLVVSVSPFLRLVNSSFYFFFWGGGGLSLAYSLRFSILSEVCGKIRVQMSETLNINANKHKMLCTTVILICNKIKIICKILFTKMSKFFDWEITRLIQFHDCLFIEPRISWWSETQTILTCTIHWPVCNSAIWTGGLPTTREQVSKLCTWGCTMYLHNYIWTTFVILAAFVFPFYYYYYYYYCYSQLKKENR